MKTPYPELHREFWHEFDRQEYWISKWQQRNTNDIQSMTEKALRTPSKLIAKVEYNKKHGNRWINYIYATPIVNGRSVHEYHSVCYWEGYGSFGTFTAYANNNEKLIILSTTHYWQRYCERTKTAMQGVHTAMDFYCQHPSCKTEIMPPADGEKRRQICIHYTCGAAFGIEISEQYHIFEMRTFIDNASMTGNKARHHKEILKDMESDNMNKGVTQLHSICSTNKGMQIGDALEYVSSEYRDDTFLCIANMEEKFIRNNMKKLRKTLSHEQAVEELLKDPIFKGNTAPEGVLRFEIAINDLQHHKEQIDESFKTFTYLVEKQYHTPMPPANRNSYLSVYTDGYNVGVDVIKDYIIRRLGMDPRFKDKHLESFLHYKDEAYLKMKAHYEKDCACEPKNIRAAVIIVNTMGFTNAIIKTSAMAKVYLGIDLISDSNVYTQ